MKQENVHDFFHNVSRITIILPIVIIALGIILKSGKSTTSQVQSTQYSVSPTISPAQSLTPTSMPITLTGPLVCSFDPESDYKGTIYIKNQQIYANVLPKDEVATMSVLLKDDCVYKWQNGEKTGVKICNVSQYVTILNTMANFKLLDANTIMSIITQFGQANGATNIPKNVASPKCQTGAVADNLFTIPKTVQFQLKTAKPSAAIK